MLENNAELKTRLDNKLLPTRRLMQVPVGGGYSKPFFVLINFFKDGRFCS